MSRLQWFRLYTEARTDRKLAMLTDAEHRIWFDLMCYAFEQTGKQMRIEGDDADDRESLAVEVAGGDCALLETTLAKLVKPLRILSIEPGCIAFINGESRQYDKPSDHPEATRGRKEKSRTDADTSRAVTRSHAESPLEESRGEESRKSSARDDDEPRSLATFPECFERKVSFMESGKPGPMRTCRAHVMATVERKHVGIPSPADLGMLGAALRLGCPADCDGSRAFDCCRLVVEKVERAHTLSKAAEFVRKDAR